MFVLLFYATPLKSLGESLATVAFDHGLTKILPGVFEGEVTAGRKALLMAAVRKAIRRRRPFRVDLVVLPEGRVLRRFRRMRG